MNQLTKEVAARILVDLDRSEITELHSRPGRHFVNTLVTLASGRRYVIRWAKSESSEQNVYCSLGAEVAVLRYMRQQNVPGPEVYKVDLSGEVIDRAYAVFSIVHGSILSHVATRLDVSRGEFEQLVYEAGMLLRKIHAIRLAGPGRITASGEPDGQNICLKWQLGALGCKAALEKLHKNGELSAASLTELRDVVKHFAPICANPPEGCRLLHGDYHAWNILADKAADDTWQISGVLDTEEALAGDIYFDMAVVEYYFFRGHGGWLCEPFRRLRESFLLGYGGEIDWSRYKFYYLARFLDFDMCTPLEKRVFLDMLERPGKGADMTWLQLPS